MFSLQYFLFLLLIFFSLASFHFAVNSGNKSSSASTSRVLYLHSDLLFLVFRRLTPGTLSNLPEGHVKKEYFHGCLENWLSHLKEWNKDELANVKGANEMAQRFGFTGDTKDTSFKLSDPSDNTQPAPWANGLSIVLLQAAIQLNEHKEPTLLMPWIFIPDDQAFHFLMVYQKITLKRSIPCGIYFRSDVPMYYKTLHLLIPESDTNFIKHTFVYLDAAYVRHNRDTDPKKKSQVNDLTEYQKDDPDLYRIWYELSHYPWLKHYVKFGKAALIQLLDKCEAQLEREKSLSGEYLKNVKDMRDWLLEEQWKNSVE